MKARLAVVLVALVVSLVALTGCSAASPHANSAASAPVGTSVRVTLTDSGCASTRTSVPAGSVTFTVTSTSTSSGAVSELELQRSGRIVAERENIAPGLSGSFSADLQPGSYRLVCPGGTGTGSTPFTVGTSSAPDTSTAP